MGIGIIFLLIGITTLSHTAPFPFILDAAGREVSIWRVPPAPGQKLIYLTFDDGPNPSATPDLLDLLKEKNVRATFFLINKFVTEETAPIVGRMFAEGHTVAQHSADRWLMLRSPGKLAAQLRADADRVEALTGRRPSPFFRPHGGWRSLPMLRGVARIGYKLVGWSWMHWDVSPLRKRTGERVASRILSHAAPGAIIVIHDGHHINPQADRRYAIEAARRIIDGLRERGYEFATLADVQSNVASGTRGANE